MAYLQYKFNQVLDLKFNRYLQVVFISASADKMLLKNLFMISEIVIDSHSFSGKNLTVKFDFVI